MGLKTISVSEDNYRTLKNLGGAGDSFNDVITELIGKKGAIKKGLQSDRSPSNTSLTAARTSTDESIRSKEM
jgi:predicted CopG family antitoxin